MSAYIIWGAALAAYALFYCWYTGFRRKVTPDEADSLIARIDAEAPWNDSQRDSLRQFLAEDDGRDFVMVNLILLKHPARQSRQDLARYQKIFLGRLLRKAGHPVLVATAASGNVENVACEDVPRWHAAGMIRYRSRRDLLEMLEDTIGSDHHELKLASLERTFAFPAAPWFIFGGPALLAPLVIALIAALIHLVM